MSLTERLRYVLSDPTGLVALAVTATVLIAGLVNAVRPH